MSTHPFCLRHPGYPTGDILFTMAARDGRDRDRIHYATVWTACSIILNNSTDHWLSPERSGEPRAAADADGLLLAGDYFLHRPRADAAIDTFPIVPNFRSWQFPHRDLPDLWHEASVTDTQRATERASPIRAVATESCRITKRSLATRDAHVIPKAEKPWFASNQMARYARQSAQGGDIVADTHSNIIRLTADAHDLWHTSEFSIVPRRHDPSVRGASWHTLVLSDGEELCRHWHGIELQSLAGRPAHYLFARFAWDIFPRLHTFLRAGRERALLVCGADGTIQDRKYAGRECSRLFTEKQGRNRSASLLKRSRTRADSDDDRERQEGLGRRSRSSGDGCISDGADSAVGGHESRLSQANSIEHGWEAYEDRGRKRHRLFT